MGDTSPKCTFQVGCKFSAVKSNMPFDWDAATASTVGKFDSALMLYRISLCNDLLRGY